MSSSSFGLIPGANTGGWNVPVPYSAQQGGQASLGGAVNPFLYTGGNGTSMPQLPQGAVSTSATAGVPVSTATATPSTSLAPLTGIAAQPNNPNSGAVPITNAAASFGLPTSTQGQQQLWDQLSKTYGSGMATTLMNFLSSGAGFNQDAVNNLIASLQPGFTNDQQNLLTSFSAGGNRFSSGAQYGLSNLMGQEQLDVGQLETQMYEQSLSDYMDVLMGTAGTDASRIAGQNSQSGGLAGLMSLISGGASAVNVGTGASGTLQQILNGLEEL